MFLRALFALPLSLALVATAQNKQDQNAKSPSTRPTSAPTTQRSSTRKPPQAAILAPLLRNVERPRAGIRPDVLREAGGGAGGGLAAKRSAGALLPEGTIVAQRPGRFVRSDGRASFQFDAAGEDTPLPPLEIQKNSWLGAMERAADAGVTDFLLTGEITTYRGRNYLIVLNFRRRISHGNVGP